MTNARGKNKYIRETWADSTNVEDVRRYALKASESAIELFLSGATLANADQMEGGANDLRRVSTRLLSYARLRKRLNKTKGRDNGGSTNRVQNE